ncbi:MAG: hypothetical protein UT66_C0015G0012 [candidate division CPR2 bacterium GW2011_GWC1_39_9]|uniref:Uncharacterized protein n=1 Tax=candidate division CPR2 bacterium GW2011_GWC2_39_10 TaxID=1618345 RepID=A0A0G0LVE9_UNCC2|nr:MAG: hypothetical protein UT18_C0005G0012 [candidate division CPR2 bacterium GW2011_GWC2_39_10]KKR34848.1 MAG: hypothetical protein UT66_C0015G0012 [candidate division CPR2 bacterium GW2011_GWC1_39_9]
MKLSKGILYLGMITMLLSIPVIVSAVDTGIVMVKWNNIYDFLQFIVKTMLSIAAIIAVIFLIIGGVRYVVSAGNTDSVEGAKNTILYAVIGLIVIMLAWFIVTAVANIFGSDTDSGTPSSGSTQVN